MRNSNWTFIILICFISFSCEKSENQEIKKIPVKYYLSDEDKSLLDYFYDNNTISYLDQDNEELVFVTDSLYSILEKYEGSYYSGEELNMHYKCNTEYFPNYSFLISLFAVDTLTVRLHIGFGTGTYWHERNNDYVFSIFEIDPTCLASLDTTFQNGASLKFDYYDSLLLRTEIFHNVYHISYTSLNSSIKQTKECYYTNEFGVVAFENFDEKFWIREMN